MAEMNEFAKRWVEALLSGKYKQGRGCMRTANNEFCCLGVALDVMAPDEWSTETSEYAVCLYGHENWQVYHHKPSRNVELLPEGMWGLLTEGACDQTMARQSCIADANDMGVAFEEIVKRYILPMWQTEEGKGGA